MALFSQRYADLVHNENGQSEDRFCGGVSFRVQQRLGAVLFDFREPKKYRADRYSKKSIETDALTVAVMRLNEELGFHLLDLDFYPHYSDMSLPTDKLSMPYLFDLIELQYSELSDKEKESFREEINDVFRNGDVPWLLVDGRMIKVDSTQFEHDLKARSVERLHELAGKESVFQSACDELAKAIEFLKKGEYAEAVTNACKSYESVMKVICGDDKATANKLIQRISDEGYISLPSRIQTDGFKNNVLSSLPYLRNRVAAHGAGADDASIPRSLANLAVNLAAALDTYLIDEYMAENSRD